MGAIVAAGSADPKWIKKSAWGSDLSPDGRYLTYATAESGRFEVWVQQLDGEFRQRFSDDDKPPARRRFSQAFDALVNRGPFVERAERARRA